MKFTLARRKLENANIDKGEENVTETKNVIDEHNLFSMSQQDQNVPPEEKIIDVHEDLNEDIENQDNIKEDNDNMGEVHEINANKGNEKLDDESLREKLRMMNKGIANLNSGSDESKDDENVNDSDVVNNDDEGEKSEKQELKDIQNYLVKFIDKLVSIFPQFMANPNLEERNQLKSQFFTIEPLAWSGFIALSKALYGQDNWEEKLNKLNTRVQFDGWEGEFLNRENPIFRKILREGNKIINTTASVKWINTVFIKFVNENKSLDEIAKED